MEWIETTAKTVDDAKELALDQLHVDEADAEFEVVEEPRQGLFGRTRGEARVRARVRPVQPRPKVDRRERRRPARRKGADRSPASTDDATRDESGDAGQRETERANERGAERSESGGGRSRNRRRSGGKQQGTERSTQSPTGEDVPKRRQTNEESTVSDDPSNDVTVHEQAAIVQTFVEGLVDAFGTRAEVRTEDVDEDTVEVHVDGDDLGLMVGPRGATLQAIHDLSRSVVQRQATGTHHGRVRLDIAGYRERRRDALERFTQKLAQEALASGVAQVLEPMSAADRKVVHDTANSIDGVHTVSEGEDARRHVVIIPDGAS